MMEDKRIVWTNIDLDPEDWNDDLREQFPDLDENALYEKMWSLNNEYLDDERANFDLYVGSPILVLADLGLWNGSPNLPLDSLKCKARNSCYISLTLIQLKKVAITL